MMLNPSNSHLIAALRAPLDNTNATPCVFDVFSYW